MADNFVQQGRALTCVFATAQTPGTFVYVGENVCGVVQAATVQTGASTHEAAVDTEGVYNLAIVAIDGSGSKAVLYGDRIFWNATESRLDKKDSGRYAGTYVGATITAGATATGPLKLKGGA